MKHEDTISIDCTKCKAPLSFSLKKMQTALPYIIDCPDCGNRYGIDSGELAHQLTLFVELCQQIKKSQEILGSAAVAVTVGPHEVQVPFKLLLSRFRSTLNIVIGGVPTTVSYRTEPLKVAEALLGSE